MRSSLSTSRSLVLRACAALMTCGLGQLAVAAEGGLQATFYPETPWFSGSTITRRDPAIDLGLWPAPTAVPAGGRWSAVWSGALLVPADVSDPCRILVSGNAGYELLIDGWTALVNWSEHDATTGEVTLALPAGAHQLEVRAFHNESRGPASLQLAWSLGPHLSPVPIPPEAYLPYMPPALPGSGDGLQATYYVDQAFTEVADTAIVPGLDADWGTEGPGYDLPGDRFAVQWDGWLEAPYSQLYTFTATADDTCELWIDDVRVLGDLAVRPAGDVQGQLYLVGGQRYAVRMRYRQVGDAARIGVTWSGALLPRQAIPTAQLFTPTTGIGSWHLPQRTTVSPVWSEVTTLGRDLPLSATVGDRPLTVTRLDAVHAALTDASGSTLGIPLEPGANTIALVAGDVASPQTRSVVWEALDLGQITSNTLPVALRIGDTLLATATGLGTTLRIEEVVAADTIPLCAITIPGPLTPGTAVRIQALRPGTCTIRALIDDQEVGRVTVAAVSAMWQGSDPLACQVGFRRTATLRVANSTAAHLGRIWVGAGDTRHLEASLLSAVPDQDASWRQVQLRALDPVASTLQVRLGGPSGPLVTQVVVQPLAVTVETETHAPVLEVLADGSRAVGCRLRLQPALPGINIRLGIFTSGAQFPDGSIDQYVDSGTLSDGFLAYTILAAPDAGSYVCHVINLHQDGVLVGTR
jgi:hypothetical protein